MSARKSTQIKVAMSALVLFAIAGILYFDGLLKPTNDTAPLNRIESNAGMPTESAAGPAMAQFKADCMYNGQLYAGTVSVSSLQSPKDLQTVELKTTDGRTVTFKQTDANCTYAPY